MKNQIKYWCYKNWKFFKFIINSRNKQAILLDTPTHGNIGDQAIVLAEMQILEAKHIHIYEVPAEEINNQEKKYAAFTPMNQTVLIPGGGFLGTLWPNEEERFRRILQAFNTQKIIVFPQTITFDIMTKSGREYLKESQKIYSSHPNLTIFVREQKSYKFMKKYFPSVHCKLVPDIVTLLYTESDMSNRTGILLCMRQDREKIINSEELKKIEQSLREIFPDDLIQYTDTVVEHGICLKNRKSEVDRKLNEFAKSKLIITDRLHGMIFSMLTGTPCIAFGNSNGKVKAVHEWIKEKDYIIYVDKLSEFPSALKKLNFDKKNTYDNSKIYKFFKPLLNELNQISDFK